MNIERIPLYIRSMQNSVCVLRVYYEQILLVFSHSKSSEIIPKKQRKPHNRAVFLMFRLMRHYSGDTVVVSETVENTTFYQHRVYFMCILREALFSLTHHYTLRIYRQKNGSFILSMNSCSKNIDISTKFQPQKYGVLHTQNTHKKRGAPVMGTPQNSVITF